MMNFFVMTALFGMLIPSLYVIITKLASLFPFEVEKQSKKHGGYTVASVLNAHGVKHVFTLCGGHISPILVACDKIGICVVDVRDERNGAFCAEAYGKISGNLGVVIVTAGPGVTNTITAVQNAKLSESPLLVIAGASPTFSKGRGALQDVDQITLFKTITKGCFHVSRVKNIANALIEAICLAKSGSQGPVYVEIPINLLYPYKLVYDEAVGSMKSSSFTGKIIKRYLDFLVNYTFHRAFLNPLVTPKPPTHPVHSEKDVEKCLQYLATSTQPVILVGTQLLIDPVKDDSTTKILNSMGIPVFQVGFARGITGESSEVTFKQSRSDILRKADFVLLLGVYCDFRLKYGRVFDRKSKIFIVNRDKKLLSMNQGVFWNATGSILGDSAQFLSHFYNYRKFTQNPSWSSWIGEIRLSEKENEERIVNISNSQTTDRLNPAKLLLKLNESVSKNSIIVCDGGDFVGTAAYIISAKNPRRWLDPGPFGTLGTGAGYALGAYLANPTCHIILLYGDGACGFSIFEFSTLVKHSVPVIALVGNDQQYSQIKRDQLRIFGNSISTVLPNVEYHKIFSSIGCDSAILDYSYSDDRLSKAFSDAFEKLNNNKQIAFNALIHPTSLRDNSISV